MLELLFVHVPKAGGTSVNQAIRTKFGERLFVDDDGPANPISEMNLDPEGCLQRFKPQATEILHGRSAVTGHLWVRKYDGISARVRATVLRDPVERLISHYYFWRSPVNLPEHPLRAYLIHQKLELLEFARLPIMRRFYSCHLFRSTDMRSFDFICSTEELKHCWGTVTKSLGLGDAPVIFANPTRLHIQGYDEHRLDVLNTPSTRKELEDILAEDIRFYEKALSR